MELLKRGAAFCQIDPESDEGKLLKGLEERMRGDADGEDSALGWRNRLTTLSRHLRVDLEDIMWDIDAAVSIDEEEFGQDVHAN
jgi:hypothetical protein